MALWVVGSGTSLSVSAQSQPAAGGALAPAAAQQAQAAAAQVRQLTADEAVRLAAENNLGIQIARYEPQLESLNVTSARGAWVPSLNSTLQQNSTASPPNSFLSGAQGTLNTDQFSTTTEVQQLLRWGGTYGVGWDTARSTSNNVFSTFNPQIRSSVSLNYSQPLLRGFKIDGVRQQVEIGLKNQEIADVALREALATTARNVRNAYWDLAYQIASLQLARQSLDLAEESLRNTKARVEIGTTPPIDIVEAEAEVSQRREAVIVAEAQIGDAEDVLRALIYPPSMPDFWTIRIEPTDKPPFEPRVVDVDGVIRNALDRRTDLQQSRKRLEVNDVSIRFLRNQSLPDVTARFDYGLSALGGVQYLRAPGIGLTPGDIIGDERRGFGSVLGDLVTNDFPAWTAGVQFSYPLGTSSQEADLARARLDRIRMETQLRNEELQISTQVRQVARRVTTNQQRVQTTRVSSELAARRLEAEQRKFEAGTSTNFLVFQAQRDLTESRNNELRAILDYIRSLVDLETVQEAPVR